MKDTRNYKKLVRNLRIAIEKEENSTQQNDKEPTKDYRNTKAVIHNDLYPTFAAMVYVNRTERNFKKWLVKLGIEPVRLDGDPTNYYRKEDLDCIKANFDSRK